MGPDGTEVGAGVANVQNAFQNRVNSLRNDANMTLNPLLRSQDFGLMGGDPTSQAQALAAAIHNGLRYQYGLANGTATPGNVRLVGQGPGNQSSLADMIQGGQ